MNTPVDVRLDHLKSPRLSDSEMFRYRGALKKSARTMLGHDLRRKIDSSDLVQETLMVTVINLAEIVGRPKRAIYQWMISVMRFRVLSYARALKMEERRHPEPNRAARDPGPDERVIQDELKLLVMQELETYDPESVKLFRLRYFDGLGIAEIARRQNMTEAAVRGKIYRTLERIREKLKDKFA